jgi:hypothetical protein
LSAFVVTRSTSPSTTASYENLVVLALPSRPSALRSRPSKTSNVLSPAAFVINTARPFAFAPKPSVEICAEYVRSSPTPSTRLSSYWWVMVSLAAFFWVSFRLCPS